MVGVRSVGSAANRVVRGTCRIHLHSPASAKISWIARRNHGSPLCFSPLCPRIRLSRTGSVEAVKCTRVFIERRRGPKCVILVGHYPSAGCHLHDRHRRWPARQRTYKEWEWELEKEEEGEERHTQKTFFDVREQCTALLWIKWRNH